MSIELSINQSIIMLSYQYRGPKAFSEPETKAVRDFIRKQNEKQCFEVFIALFLIFV